MLALHCIGSLHVVVSKFERTALAGGSRQVSNNCCRPMLLLRPIIEDVVVSVVTLQRERERETLVVISLGFVNKAKLL